MAAIKIGYARCSTDKAARPTSPIRPGHPGQRGRHRHRHLQRPAPRRVRGGSVFDDNPRIQGFGNGLFTNPNGDPINGDAAQQRRKLLAAMDLIKIGLTGNLKDYVFKATTGDIVKGSQLVYDGKPAGYTAAPGEAVTYVDAHDNLALYDANAYKLPTGTAMADRARLQALALATTALSQGSGFAQTGTDLMRSKSFDGNSYDSGDWFNAIHFDCRTGNGFGRGLPPGDSQPMWPYAKPLLADPALVPDWRSTPPPRGSTMISCGSRSPARCSLWTPPLTCRNMSLSRCPAPTLKSPV